MRSAVCVCVCFVSSFFDALYVVPVFQCFFILVSVVGGAAYFNEFASFRLLQIVFFPTGIVLTLTGVQILSARKMSKPLSSRSRTGTADALLMLISDPAAASHDEHGGGDEEDVRRTGGRSRSSDNLVRAVRGGSGSTSAAASKHPPAARHYKVSTAPAHLLAPPDSRRFTATPDTDRTIDASIQLISGARSSEAAISTAAAESRAANESPVFGPSPLLRECSNDLNMPLCDDAEAEADADADADDSPPAATEPRVKFFLPTGDAIEAESGALSSRHRRNHSAAAHGSDAAAASSASSAAAAIFIPASSAADDSSVAFRPPPLERTQSRFARRYSQLLDLTALAEEEDAENDAASDAVGSVAPVPSLHGSAMATARHAHGHSRHATLDGPSLLALMSSHHADADAVLTVAHRRTRSTVANGSPVAAAIAAGAAASGAGVAIAGHGRKSRRSSLGPAGATLWDAGATVFGSRPPSPPLPSPSLPLPLQQQASSDHLLEL